MGVKTSVIRKGIHPKMRNEELDNLNESDWMYLISECNKNWTNIDHYILDVSHWFLKQLNIDVYLKWLSYNIYDIPKEKHEKSINYLCEHYNDLRQIKLLLKNNKFNKYSKIVIGEMVNKLYSPEIPFDLKLYPNSDENISEDNISEDNVMIKKYSFNDLIMFLSYLYDDQKRIKLNILYHNYLPEIIMQLSSNKLKTYELFNDYTMLFSGVNFNKLFPKIKLFCAIDKYKTLSTNILDRLYKQKIHIGLNDSYSNFNAYEQITFSDFSFEEVKFICPIKVDNDSTVTFSVKYTDNGNYNLMVSSYKFIFETPIPINEYLNDEYFENEIITCKSCGILKYISRFPEKYKNKLLDKCLNIITNIYDLKNVKLSGKDFNRFVDRCDTKLIKLTNEKEKHHNLQLADGLNQDILPFNIDKECSPGGIYITDEKNKLMWIDKLKVLYVCHFERPVTIPDDAEVYVESGCKIKVNKFILGTRSLLNNK